MGYEVDFLPVGDGEKSGDAISLRFGNLYSHRREQTVVVIDGGFKESGENLVKHIREYYNTNYVDLVISTHPDTDHASGLEVVLEQMEVGSFWMHQPWNHTDGIANLFKDGRVTDGSVREALRKSLETAHRLETLAKAKRIPIIEPFTGVTDTSNHIFVTGPSRPFYESLLPDFRGTPEPKRSLLDQMVSKAQELVHKIAEHWDYETLDDSGETPAENNSSVIILIEIDGKRLIFTGDAGIPALTDVADRLENIGFNFSSVSFIQVPHHGSQRNVGPSILDRIVGPKQQDYTQHKVAYVSAARDGLPKHPAKKVTNAFHRRGAAVFATQGRTICHSHNSPLRMGWQAITPLPFYNEVDE